MEGLCEGGNETPGSLKASNEARNPQRSGVYGELTMDRNAVSRWATRFRVSLDNDVRPGRLKISTHEQSVKLLADALQEDRRPTCDELSEATGDFTKFNISYFEKEFREGKISARCVPHCLTTEQKQ
ncbi:hypothetical protein ANN_26486 [Periplaneta americana]|uniref:Uncharacterized protein n=1 Tax=Periplaneta americana TaxID=6978 RepID=A0ABQ8RY79_PERAM|nr:hypothetical protein ANN_26486 [Periplaneta americana]